MTWRRVDKVAVVALALLVPALLVACGDEGDGDEDADKGLTRAEVEAMVRAETADAPAPSESGPSREEVEGIVEAAIAAVAAPEPGLTEADVAEAVEAAIAAVAAPEPGLTGAEAARIARSAGALIPSKSTPAEYTKFFVENAVSRYESQGLEATVAHYNRAESVDGQWYVFVIDENDLVAAHHSPHLRGLDLKGPLGTDANGYNFGPDMLSASEDGRWVSYVYQNPDSGRPGADATGALELKNAWMVRHDGLLFGSGWYVNADEFAQSLVAEAADLFHSVGLEATVAYFRGPDSIAAGLATAIDYYNTAETVEGQWFAFIAEAAGKIVAHYDPQMIGRDLQDLFGADTLRALQAAADGAWVTHQGTDLDSGQQQSTRAWTVNRGGMLFASGWHNNEPDN